MLKNTSGAIINLPKANEFGVKYSPMDNCFEADKPRNVRLYENLRKGLKEKHMPQEYPKNGMFSIQSRASLKG